MYHPFLDENCLQQFVADSFSFQQTSKRGRADVPIQSSTGEVQSRTEHVESKTEQVHLDQENRTEKETVDHNSERTGRYHDYNSYRTYIWPEAAVFLFLEVFRAKEDEFKKTKRHNKIWQ
nr:unnamed protein product [Callosobruchus analis]